MTNSESNDGEVANIFGNDIAFMSSRKILGTKRNVHAEIKTVTLLIKNAVTKASDIKYNWGIPITVAGSTRRPEDVMATPARIVATTEKKEKGSGTSKEGSYLKTEESGRK